MSVKRKKERDSNMLDVDNDTRNPHLLERYQERILKNYQKKFPVLFRICFDPIGTHRHARTAFAFGLGFVLGIFLYVFIIVDLDLNRATSFTCGALLVTLLSFGCAFSLQFRCVCLLTIPGLFGRAGRSVLKALVLGYIIAGPIFNLTFNAKEVMRSFACTTHLTYNLTKTKYDLMFRPFKQAMMNMNESAEQLRETLGSVNELIEPIAREIEGEDELRQIEAENNLVDVEMEAEHNRSEEIHEKAVKEMQEAKTDGEKYEAKYREKITERCHQQLSRGSERCRDMFGDAYDKCYETVTWMIGWLLCWPMKLTFVCNLVEALGGKKICNPDGKIDVGVGEGYATLKETRDKFNESLRDAKIEYNIDTKPIVVGVSDATRIATGVMRDFEARKRFCDGVITLIKRCISLVFLKIILNASRYHHRYLRDIEFDNVYVTPYFRRIDARRKARGSLTLLPLKKLERTKLLDPYSLKQTRVERRNLIGQTAKLVLEILTASIFVLIDRMLYEVLDVVRRHAKLEITQSGHHAMSLEIRGRGLVASLVRGVVRGFNVKRRIHNVVTNEACLPRASSLPGLTLFRIYGTYLAVWLMLLLQAYSQRLRREIAGFFYRKREKRRVLYLYNETLRRRLGFLRFARGRVAELARARRLGPDPQPWLKLRLKYPKYFWWLVRFECARRMCVVCGEVESRLDGTHKACANGDCFAVYCDECWVDVGRTCLACVEIQEESEHSPGDNTEYEE